MAIPKSTSVKALARLRAERAIYDAREREARRETAIELGEAVLKAADLSLEPSQVGQILNAVMKHGFDAAMALLLAPMAAGPARKAPSTASDAKGADHVAR